MVLVVVVVYIYLYILLLCALLQLYNYIITFVNCVRGSYRVSVYLLMCNNNDFKNRWISLKLCVLLGLGI